MNGYHTILWDVDQTLLDFKKSERYAVTHCFELFHLPVDDQILNRYSEINEGYWKRIERGEIEKEEALSARFDTLFDELGITGVDGSSFQNEYAEALGSIYFFLDDSYGLLKRLKGKYRQYLVTNGVARTQLMKLKLSGLDLLVEDIFVSEEIGAVKPSSAFFDACFEKIPYFEKERTIIVGDSLSSDMLGGDQAGIATCWYNPENLEKNLNVRVDYEIKNLYEIIEICKGA